MAIQHIVWIKNRGSAGEEQMRALLDRIKALQKSIPGVISISAGRNFTDRANGYSHGAIITLIDRQALQNYIEHPRHTEVATQLAASCDILVLDYEV